MQKPLEHKTVIARIFCHALMSFTVIFSLLSCSDDEDSAITAGSGTIYGMIVDGQTNEPLQGASVTLYPSGRTVLTGGTGQYEFRDLHAGGYLLQVSKSNFLSNTQSVTIAGETDIIQSDIALNAGASCLNVLIGELFFGGSSNSKTFIVSNTGQQNMNWNLYTDYNSILNFDVTSGVLEPGESQAVTVTMNRSMTSADLTAFPIYVHAGGEELGVIATIDRRTAGHNNSLLVGEWELVYMQFLQDDEIWYNSIEEGSSIYNFHSDYIVELCTRQIVSDQSGELDNMFSYGYDSYEYDYDAAENIVVLDPDMGFRNSVYRINTLNENTLELETVLVVGTPEWRLMTFKRRS